MTSFASLADVSALERALDAETGDRPVVLTCDAPSGLGRALTDLPLTDHAVYWNPGCSFEGSSDCAETQQETYVGFGAAYLFRLEGKSRFRDAQRLIEQAYRELNLTEELKAHLRFFGGAAFNPGRDGEGPCWKNFGDASFLLPRVTYWDDGRKARLFCVVKPSCKDEVRSIVRSILETPPPAPLADEGRTLTTERKDSSSEGRWASLIFGIQDSIQKGEVQKVVAARRLTLHLSDAPLLSSVIARLNESAPASARFALRIMDRIFVGATPERLISKAGLEVRSEALAGSISSQAPDAAGALMNSQKDRREHAYVVEALRDALGSECSHLTISDAPEIRRLPQLYHLCTPVRGELARSCHILTLVERLHPTPAVGGLPREEALRFIAEHEEVERGWYAAPIGWVNCDGDGHFAVALRSALLCGNKAHVYAGAGIVAESESSSEFLETELKLGSMLSALGLSSESLSSESLSGGSLSSDSQSS